MSVYVPSKAVLDLQYAIWNAGAASMEGAYAIAREIKDVAIFAAQSALNDSKAYTQITEQVVYGNVDRDMRAMDVHLFGQIDTVKDALTSAISTLSTQVAALAGTASAAGEEELVKAYDSIAESHGVAGEMIDKTIMATGESIEAVTETVGGWIHEQFDGALAVVNSTIDHILKIPAALIDLAVKYLVPAMTGEWLTIIGKILIGDDMDSLVTKLKTAMSLALGGVFSVDEKEVEVWIKKFNDMMSNIAVQPVTMRGV